MISEFPFCFGGSGSQRFFCLEFTRDSLFSGVFFFQACPHQWMSGPASFFLLEPEFLTFFFFRPCPPDHRDGPWGERGRRDWSFSCSFSLLMFSRTFFLWNGTIVFLEMKLAVFLSCFPSQGETSPADSTSTIPPPPRHLPRAIPKVVSSFWRDDSF